MRSAARTLVVAAACAVAALGVPTVASASFGDPTAPASPPPVNSGQATATAKTCTMYGSSNGFGMVCSDPTGGSGTVSLLSYLGGRPLPQCWDETPPNGFQPPEPKDTPGAWWLQTCLRGLDPATLIRTGPLSLDFSFVYLPPGGQVILDAGQQTVIDYFYGEGQIPFPVLQTTPTASPRVNEVVSFRLLEDSTPRVTTGGVQMYAQVVGLRISPGDGSPDIYCQGPGRALTAEQAADPQVVDQPDVCSHAYDRSSFGAGQVGGVQDRYPVQVTAYWQIRYVDDAGEHVLGTYDKQALNAIRVTEVQTLVVT